MHIIQVVRSYLGLSQQELAEKAGITQPDLCEMEIKEPYGRIDKYQRLSQYLGIPVHALVTNNCTQIPISLTSIRSLRTQKQSPGTTRSLAEMVKMLHWHWSKRE